MPFPVRCRRCAHPGHRAFETNEHVYELLEYWRSETARLSFLRWRCACLAQRPRGIYQPSS